MMKTLAHLTLSLAAATGALAAERSADAMPPYVSRTGTWAQGQVGATPLAHSTTDFCYLTRVAGSFKGGGEWVNVWQDGSQTWYVGGASQKSGVAASANCIPFRTFVPEPGGVNNWTNWFSETTGSVAPPKCGGIWGGCFQIPGRIQMDAWLGDAAVLLSGITGQFDGGGEWVEARQSANAWTANVFASQAGSANGVGGWAQTLFVGHPQSGFTPSFYGPGGAHVMASQAGVYTASSSAGRGTTRTWMARTSDAFCYFTRIGGSFVGAGESVQISPVSAWGIEFWVLDVTSGQSNGTSADARCYALDQSRSQL